MPIAYTVLALKNINTRPGGEMMTFLIMPKRPTTTGSANFLETICWFLPALSSDMKAD
jgi:hypothetical protein